MKHKDQDRPSASPLPEPRERDEAAPYSVDEIIAEFRDTPPHNKEAADAAKLEPDESLPSLHTLLAQMKEIAEELSPDPFLQPGAPPLEKPDELSGAVKTGGNAPMKTNAIATENEIHTWEGRSDEPQPAESRKESPKEPSWSGSGILDKEAFAFAYTEKNNRLPEERKVNKTPSAADEDQDVKIYAGSARDGQQDTGFLRGRKAKRNRADDPEAFAENTESPEMLSWDERLKALAASSSDLWSSDQKGTHAARNWDDPQSEAGTPDPARVPQQEVSRAKAVEAAATGKLGAPEGPSPDVVLFDGSFEPPEGFERFFAPSDDYVRDDPYPDTGEVEEEYKHKDTTPLFVRLRRRARRADEEPSGLSVQEARTRLVPFLRFLLLRTLVALVLCLPILYITFSHRMGWPTPAFLTYTIKPYMYLSLVLILQVLVMICATDMLAQGLKDLCKLRPTSSSAVLISCLANIVYVASIFFAPENPAYLPYCSVSSLSVLFLLLGQCLRHIGFERTYRTVAAMEHPLSVVREENLWDGQGAFVKSHQELTQFVDTTESQDGAAQFESFFVPLALLASLLLALIASFGQKHPERFFWAFSAIVSVTAPFCAAFTYALPFSKVSMRLASSGVALAGWAAARAFSDHAAVVLTDDDIFPPGLCSLNGLKVFGNNSFDRVISYAASLMKASGSGLSTPFIELLRGQSGLIRPVENFQHYEGGGMGGEIGSDRILLGTSTFMLRMGIGLPQGLRVANAIFVAVNLDLVGVFAINYQVSGSVRRSLVSLLRHKLTTVFAVRNVNISPLVMKKKFKVGVEAVEFPSIEERLFLSDPKRANRSRPVAAVRDPGLTLFADSILAGRRLWVMTRINLLFYAICTVCALVLMSFLCMQGEAVTASPCNVLIYLSLWLVPTLVSSGWVSRY